MKLVCHKRFDKVATVLFQSRDAFWLLGVGSLRLRGLEFHPKTTTKVYKHQGQSLKVCLGARAIARPGVAFQRAPLGRGCLDGGALGRASSQNFSAGNSSPYKTGTKQNRLKNENT
jgi:hypothetical protein